MFFVNTITDTAFEKVVLFDDVTNTSAAIIPSCGAILHAFTVLHNGTAINIVDGYNSQTDFENCVAEKGFKSCKLSPFACRINNATYQFEGRQYFIEKFLLNGSALHGLIYDAVFSVTKNWANEDGAGVELYYQYKATDNGYPFTYTCKVVYELKKDSALTITTAITNTHHAAIPMQDGWHPYFSFGGSVNELQLLLNSTSMVAFSEALIPTGDLVNYTDFEQLRPIGKTELDNCFVLKTASTGPSCLLKDDNQQIQLEIYADKSYPYLQIYIPPHRNSIAIENLSAPPDAFNNNMGLIVLQPASTIHFTTTYKITSLL
ncbi:MAG: aldose 1-epimerase [Ferruginibacter sp.]